LVEILRARYNASPTPFNRQSAGVLIMFPNKSAPLLFGFILSGLMSLLVSGIATFRAVGVVPDFVTTWMQGWLTAWVIAFPIVLIVAPLTRRLVQRLVVQASIDHTSR
jgi:hypothetical protein